MKLIRCNNGHFYDQDKFSSCPNCKEGGGASEEMTEAFLAPPAGQSIAQPVVQPVVQPTVKSVVASPQAIQTPSQAPSSPPVSAEVDVTVPLRQAAIMNEINSVFVPEQRDEDVTIAMTPGGRAVGKVGLKPVVGWLVCLSGEHKGRDFRLVQGKNFIGRDVSMDICLEHEKTVSREKHALIVYEPMHHEYLIQSGESRELTYVNDKVVLESTVLHAMDEVLVGQVKLMFVPLCSTEFNWEDVLEKEEGNEEDHESKPE